MPSRPSILGLLFVVLSALGASAQPYHVATAADGGDDGNDGSPGAPWATITHALDTVPDESLILVAPGTYTGRIRIRGSFPVGVTVRSEVPYEARLRHDAAVLTVYDGQGITIEGFDVAHSGPGAGGLVIQVQDLIGEPGGADRVERIVLRNNILHDSYNNDVLKVNNGAADVLIEGNLFYNQTGSDEHIDINSVERVVVQDNIFLNDFAASGRVNEGNTSSFIVVKDSNADSDTVVGSRDITVRRNVFLNFEGGTGANYLLFGEDGQPFYETIGGVVENNLMIGTSIDRFRAPFGVKGCQDIDFRHNTLAGDMFSRAFVARINTEGANLPIDQLVMVGNVFSDPTGTMDDFTDSPIGQTNSFTLARNLYWNGGNPIPAEADDMINFADDPAPVLGDPVLGDQAGLLVPTWDESSGRFRDGSATIREAFERLVELYGTPGAGSAAVDAGDPGDAPLDDILGNPRPSGSAPDLGAVEVQVVEPPELVLRVTGGALADVTWEAVPGALHHDTYRGSLPPFGLSSRGAGLAVYDHVCFEAADALGDGPLQTRDGDPPSPGNVGWYYLVSVTDGAGEGSLGRASSDLDAVTPGVQLLRPNDAPCP
ncbi:MAG: choice-of-anchor Q domain-containing protein [Acidobacteriota bacterium]